MDLDGRRWIQKIVAVITDTIDRLIIETQMEIRCHCLTTMRSKKVPSESFAIAIPITAKVCPIISL